MEFVTKDKRKIGLLIDRVVIQELATVGKQHNLSKSEIVNQILFNHFGFNKRGRKPYAKPDEISSEADETGDFKEILGDI